MLAKSVITKSKDTGGFKKLVSNELKTISSQKTKESSDPFATLKRQELCNYIKGKNRGKNGNGKDARIADWLKYLCALLVLYVTAPTKDGNDKISEMAASHNTDKMYGMIGDNDVPLDPGSYEDETPPKPPCDAMPIQQDPPNSTVSLNQQFPQPQSKPHPTNHAELELSEPQHHPIASATPSQKPYIPIDNQLPPKNVSLNQQPTTNITNYRYVKDLTTEETAAILRIAHKLAELSTTQPMLSQADFAKQARQTAPINSCKEEASYNYITTTQITTNENGTMTYGTSNDQNCTLTQTLDAYHTCRRNSQESPNICIQLIALFAGPCTFANNNDNPQLDIVKENNKFVEKVKTALFPTHQNQQPQPKKYPQNNPIQYQQTQFNQGFPQQLKMQFQQQQFNQGFPQQHPMNQYIPNLQPPTHTVTQNPPQTPFTQQPTQYPMNQYIPQLQPPTQTVTPNPQQQNPYQAKVQPQIKIPTTLNNFTPQPNPNLQPSNPLQTQVQPKMQIPTNQNDFQPQHQTYQNQPTTDVQQTHPLPPSHPYQNYLFFIPDLDGCKTHEKNYYVTMPDRIFVFPADDVQTLKALVTQLPQTEGIPFEKVPTEIIQEFDNPNLTAQKHSLYTFAKLLFPKANDRISVKFAESFALCFSYSGKNTAYNSFLDAFRNSLNYTAYALAVFDQIEFLETLIASKGNATSGFGFRLKSNIETITSSTPTFLRELCTDDALQTFSNKTQDFTINWITDVILTDLQDDLPLDFADLNNFLDENIPDWQQIKPSDTSIKPILNEINTNIIDCYQAHKQNDFKRYYD